MPKNNENHQISFKNAFDGLCYSLRTQPNFRLMVIIGVIVLLASFLLGLSRIEITIIIAAIFIVILTEMINTTIESITNLVTHEWRKDAKVTKDVASGMVLVAVCGSIIVGVLIFGPKLMAIIP
ncbi:MAG TPA: diacylglycerol kinase family protein [Candidatus Bathyarchaeia archaeon]|nr:diacylglycerol kinase family protein [Candidatus Bathyarchaeia archaeon]